MYIEPYVKLLQWKPLQVLAVQLAQVESMASSKRKALGSRTSDRSSWASSRRRSHIESSGIFLGIMMQLEFDFKFVSVIAAEKH